MTRWLVLGLGCATALACGGGASSGDGAIASGGAAGAHPVAGSGGAPGGAGGGAGGGAPGGAASAGGPSSAGAAGAVSSAPRLATAVTLSEVAVFQAVKIALAKGGADAKRNAPVIANRALTLRAYVAPAAGFSPRSLRAELRVSDGATETVLTETRDVAGASDDAQPASVFTFDVPAETVTTQSTLSVRVLDDAAPEVAGATPSAARYPMDGSATALSARAHGAVRVLLVPLRYDADGSKRLPDTGAARVAELSSLLRAVYPISDVQLAVHAPVPWTQGLTLTGNVKFGAINGLLIDLRDDEGIADDVYVYGLINPAATFSAYCGGSCVTGQSYVVDDPSDGATRVGSGVGFGGQDSAWTLAHELGHMHGREHAPCDTDQWDPSYPYKGGGLGVLGFDQRSGALLSPTKTTDVMGYCDPLWISDYTYSALFERVLAVSGDKALSWRARPPNGPSVRVDEEADGTLTWGTTAVRPPRGAPGAVAVWRGASGEALSTVAALRAPLAHGGATWFVPPPPQGSVAIDLAGRTLPSP